MFGLIKKALSRDAQGGGGADNNDGPKVQVGLTLPTRPGATPPPKREGHAHHNGHRAHPAHEHRNGSAPHAHGAESKPNGVAHLTVPRGGRPSAGPVVEVSLLLPAKYAVNHEGQPATTVAVHCDKHDNWAPFELTKLVDGAWQGKMPVPEKTSWIHYYFKIDGQKVVLDPQFQRTQDHAVDGGYVNARQARH